MPRKPKNAYMEIRDAAVRACAGLLFKSGLDKNNPADFYIMNNVLKELVWSYTGNHKDNDKHLGCPWWSKEALDYYDSGASDYKKRITLEHVIERKDIHTQLFAAETVDQIRSILEGGDTCVVLRSQHDKLPKGGGWTRYAGINVVPGPKARMRLGGAQIAAPNSN